MSQVTHTVWSEILGHVRRLHPDLAKGWFGQLEPGHLDRGELTVSAADPEQYHYLTHRSGRAFAEAAQLTIGRLVSVRFVLAELSAPQPEPPQPGQSPVMLNNHYTFENFITGPCNRLAHAACVAVSDAPGQAYNPLFIHGSVGLGKTHLLQATCGTALATGKAKQVLYLTCEAFANDFLDAVQRGELNTFRYRYRHVDVLVIDDVQFLAERERSQEEFFHTFNTLYQMQKQIIVSADSSPAEIPSLEERLVSRFSWGLVTRIDKPCFETRMAIVRKKAELRGVELVEEVVYFIASRIDTNIRELEGAINKVEGLSRLTGQVADLALAREALGDKQPPREISIEEILEAVMRRYNVRLTDLQSKKRSKSIAFPRQVCMYLARTMTRHSLEEIGGYFGGRDHTTVLHASRTIERRRAEQPQLQTALDEIGQALRGLDSRR